MKMPVLDYSKLNGESLEYAKAITKPSGEVYVARPKKASGEAQYVWRMVCFHLIDEQPYSCMPVMADWYMTERDYDKRRAECKRLDSLVVDQIVNSVPMTEWCGVIRWGRAFGVL
jgi:hypothetical protein